MPARRVLTLVPWIAALAWIAWSCSSHFHDMPWGPGWEDAYVYQRAADAFVLHPAQLYDNAQTQVASTHAQAAFIYPPSGLIPFLALVPIATDAAGHTTHAGEALAASVWTGFDLFCLVAALAIFGRRVGLDALRLGVALLLVSLTGPLLLEIASGQVNGLELLLLVLAWERMPRASGGILLGLALALKPVAALFLVALVLRRRWRALGAALGTLAIATLPFAILVGLDGVRYYVTDVGPFMLRQDTWDVANTSLSAITQMFLAGRGVTDHDARTLAPIASAGLALAVLVVLRLSVVAGVVAGLVRDRLNGDVELAVLLATIPLTAGTVWFHYYLYVVPLVFVAITSASTVLRRVSWILVLPVLFNGLNVRWVDDPYVSTDPLSRIVFAKAMLLPLLTLGLVAVTLVRAFRAPSIPAGAREGPPPESPAPPREGADARDEVLVLAGRSSEPVGQSS